MHYQEIATPAVHVFGSAGPVLRRSGFAVMPAAGKKPLMAGFANWKYPPSLATVEKWALELPEADVVYVPGLSRAKRGGPGLIVVDGDDEIAVGRIRELFGDTPGKVRTRRACTSSTATPARASANCRA